MQEKAIKQRLSDLIKKNFQLTYVLPKLQSAKVRYGLYAGAHVSILTGNRIPTDVDLLVHDDDLQKVRELFPFAKTKDVGDGVYLYIGKEDTIEFMGAADVQKEDGKIYHFRLTDEATRRITTINVDGFKFCLVDPVDTILLKSILQRGADKGKHDVEDIEHLLRYINIDTKYLKKRLSEAGALELTRPLFKKLGVTIS